MSRAYICDKCGLISHDGKNIRGIWVKNPVFFQDGQEDLHLCGECFEQFESEYMRNLREEGRGER